MVDYKGALGRWGEKVAEEFLKKKGFIIIDRNVRTPYGEIDLIVVEDDTVVFVEVKTRSTGEFGLPEEGITPQKQMHMMNAAQAYIQAHPDENRDWRVDVIAIRKMAENRSPEIIHFENVLS